MSFSRAGAGSAAVALTGLALLAVAAPASADPGDNCPNPAGTYPPGQCHSGPPGQLGDTTPQPGKSEHVHSEGWKPGSGVTMHAQSTPILLGTFTTSSAGVLDVDVTIPLALAKEVGAHTLVLQGLDASGLTRTLRMPFTVTKANAAAALGAGKSSSGAGSSKGSSGAGVDLGVGTVQLPRTGAEIGAVSAVGIALIGAGSLAVYSGRRRRLTPA